ncbi:MAG TPA: translocation/assembly module TamB domain-containing protein [Rhizomicrobium sp.]|nr:translocation/assembly module TamB domain-containing protein [Rhizomicrobium sp.]
MGRRIGQGLLVALGTILLALLLLLYTPPGLAWMGRLAGPLSGGTVRVEGLAGMFPNRLRAERVEVADRQGVWLRIDQASLRWSALALIDDHISVRDLTAARITVLRRPLASGKKGEKTPRLDIDHLAWNRIVLAAPVIGHAVLLSASGSLHYTSLDQWEADLLVLRSGSSDSYRIAGGITEAAAHGTIILREGGDGILGKLAELPGLGPVNLAAQAHGDSKTNNLSLHLSAGPLKADGQGTLRLAMREADLDFALSAPAMTPRPDISWQSLSGTAHFHGRFDTPALEAHLSLQGGTMGDLKANRVSIVLNGNAGSANLEGMAEAVTLPGEYPDLFARAPVRFQAQADLRAVKRPIRFAISHPLAELHGMAQTRGTIEAAADLAVPSLAPFAALKQIDLRGSAGLHIALAQDDKRLHMVVNGVLDAQGTAIPARLLGRKATLTLDAMLEGSDLTASRMQVKGAAVASDVSGSLRKGVFNYRLGLDLSDLSQLTPRLQGSLNLRGTVGGPLGKETLSASGFASLATPGFARQRVNLTLQANGLSALQDAKLGLEGRLDDAPVLLAAAWHNSRASLTARWRSLDAKANIAVDKNTTLAGQAHFAMSRVADIAILSGETLEGSAEASVIFKPRNGKTGATIDATIEKLKTASLGAQKLSLHGTVDDATGAPALGLGAAAQGLAAGDFKGTAQAQLKGPLDRLDIALSSDMKDSQAAVLKAGATGRLNLSSKQVRLTALDGEWRGVTTKLQSPATISFGDGIQIDRLAIQSGHGQFVLAGRIMPQLALTISAKTVALADFKSFLPAGGLQGTLSGEANLAGTLQAPQGSIAIRGRDLRAAFYSPSIPSAAFDVRAQLNGDHAGVEATLNAGANARLALSGTAPLTPDAAMTLRANGNLDLALLDPLLAADGRRVRGALTMDAAIGGSLNAPRVTGSGKLAGGEIQDYARSARIQDISAVVEAEGTRIRLTTLSGRAGPGSFSGSGTIDLAAPGMPVDVTLDADNARPIASDLITASLSGKLRLTGRLKSQTTLSGKITVPGGEINLPRNFPPEVAVLNVRRRGQPPAPPPAPESRTVLDVDVRTTGPLFVRGHGVDANMGGTIHVGGTTTDPIITGDFRMIRGNYSIAGQVLDFTTGRVLFDGVGVRGRLDPSLDFQAQTVSGGVTATLGVGGHASVPKITLSSTPVLPQDEVIAHLLFQQSVKQLTPLQLASIAQAVAAIGGVGEGFNPLGAVRRNLGLDRLSVSSANTNVQGGQNQTMVEAGRYVMRNVYVGVKQNLSGGTQTQVQVDITRRFKAQATLATGNNPATVQGNSLQSNDSSIGLSYQFEY